MLSYRMDPDKRFRGCGLERSPVRLVSPRSLAILGIGSIYHAPVILTSDHLRLIINRESLSPLRVNHFAIFHACLFKPLHSVRLVTPEAEDSHYPIHGMPSGFVGVKALPVFRLQGGAAIAVLPFIRPNDSHDVPFPIHSRRIESKQSRP